MIRIILNREKDITAFCGNVSISDNIDSISVELSFSIAKNPKDKYLTASRPNVVPGDKIDIIGETRTMFSGIVISESIKGDYTAFDYGFFLSNNDVILQANNIAADKVIQNMCGKLGIAVGELPNLTTKIDKIYVAESAANILKDILEQATAEQGKNYFFRVKDSKLNVYEYPTALTWAKHKFETGNELDITYALGEADGENSIKELRNEVKVVSSDNNVVKVLATGEDSESIARYGRMQKVVTISGEGQNPAAQVKNTLKEYNCKTKERSISNMLGSEKVEAGVLLLFSSAAYDVTGAYMVKSVTHNFGASHTMSVDVINTEGAE